jgi:hypothetical protein
MRKIPALFITFFLFLFSFLMLIYFSEIPLTFKSSSVLAKQRAAIAIRDNVIPFQKFGTRLFSFPCLTKFYDKVYYFTQYSRDDKKEDFIKSLNELLTDYPETDIYLLAHSNNYCSWISEIDTSLRKKIRMVYNTGCFGYSQAETWKNLCVKTYISHKGSSLSPVFYFYFLRRWCKGLTISEATNESNRLTEIQLHRFDFAFRNFSKTDSLVENTKALIQGDRNIQINQ